MEALVRDHLRAGRRREAFELLVEWLQHKVFRLACSILQDEVRAEDAAQDVFLRVWQALPGFEQRSSPATWVYAITRNLCLTRAKQLGTERARLGSGPEAGASGAGGPRSCVDIELALGRLPEKYRRILTLFYYEEKSYENVAEMLEMPMGTVKTHLHRARTQLRRELEVQGLRRVV